MSDNLDFFYGDIDKYSDRIYIDVVEHTDNYLYVVEIKEYSVTYIINLIPRRYKQINDCVIFPHNFTHEMYDYIVSKISRLSGIHINRIKSRFIYEQ